MPQETTRLDPGSRHLEFGRVPKGGLIPDGPGDQLTIPVARLVIADYEAAVRDGALPDHDPSTVRVVTGPLIDGSRPVGWYLDADLA